jgi:hypothetical protein
MGFVRKLSDAQSSSVITDAVTAFKIQDLSEKINNRQGGRRGSWRGQRCPGSLTANLFYHTIMASPCPASSAFLIMNENRQIPADVQGPNIAKPQLNMENV